MDLHKRQNPEKGGHGERADWHRASVSAAAPQGELRAATLCLSLPFAALSSHSPAFHCGSAAPQGELRAAALCPIVGGAPPAGHFAKVPGSPQSRHDCRVSLSLSSRSSFCSLHSPVSRSPQTGYVHELIEPDEFQGEAGLTDDLHRSPNTRHSERTLVLTIRCLLLRVFSVLQCLS